MYGKYSGDLVENIQLVYENDNPTEVTVIGTIKHIDSYNEFEYGISGNFFPFTLGVNGTTMKFKKNGNIRYTGDWDKNNVLKVEQDQIWEIIVDEKPVVTFNFSKAILQTE